MDERVVFDAIVDALVEEFELDRARMTSDAHLIETLGLDSLDFVDMVVVLQNRFGVSIRDEPRARQVRTLGDLHALVMDIRANGPGRPADFDGRAGDGLGSQTDGRRE